MVMRPTARTIAALILLGLAGATMGGDGGDYVFEWKTAEVWLKELKDPAKVSRAEETLVKGGAKAVPVLLYAIRKRDWAVGPRAIRMLTRIGPAAKAAVPELSAIVKGKGTPFFRGRTLAAEALLAIEGKGGEAEKALEVMLRSKFSWESRLAAVALAGMGRKDAKIVQVLVTDLSEYGTASDIREYCDGIAAVGPKAKAALPKLDSIMGNTFTHRDPWARLAALEAMMAIGDPAVKKLEKWLNGHLPEYRARIALWFARRGPASAKSLKGLRKAVQHKEDVQLRAAAAEALGRIGRKAKGAVHDLLHATDDKDSLLRVVAARALARLGVDGRKKILSQVAKVKGRQAYALGLSLAYLSEPGREALDDVLRTADGLLELIPLSLEANWMPRMKDPSDSIRAAITAMQKEKDQELRDAAAALLKRL